MTALVVGTAGHIDHGKTTLLRALTGIDADRLPEERRRGMTIDVGYAHLELADECVIDFVDVPGHDRLVGNMLVGAGEIDAAMLMVAADDGPRAQTIEHLELLDALGVESAIAVITKIDLVAEERVHDVTDAVRDLLTTTALAGSPIISVSALSGAGLDELKAALVTLRDRVAIAPPAQARLPIDRVFTIKGRGTVVTGTLRGTVSSGDLLRLVPRGRTVRVREVQVHGRTVDRADGGRTALNLAAIEAAELRRGDVLTSGTEVIASDRVLVSLRPSAGITALPGPGSRPRLHLATASVGATIGRRAREYAELVDGRRVVLLNLDRPIALAAGDRFALRHPSPPSAAGGGVVVDPSPPRGPSRRRLSGERLMKLVATDRPDPDARLDLHGAMNGRLAPDVARALETLAIASVEDGTRAEPTSAGLPLSALRSRLVGELRRLVHVDRAAAAGIVDTLIGDLITRGALMRAGERVRPPGVDTGQPALRESMDRLELLLAVAAPPSLDEAARAAGCPPEGIRALELERRIVRVEDNLAWATTVYDALTDRALQLAEEGPLTPAAYRDATGTSRRFVLAILEDLDRRQILRRTPDGHVRGPRAPTRAGAGR